MSALRQTPLTCSGHTRPVVDLDFSDVTEYGYFLISACKDGKPMLRQGDTGDWVGTFEGHKGAVWGATLNRQATQAATGAADFTAKVWNAVEGTEVQTFTHDHIVKCVRFSHDGSKLLTGSNEKVLRIFDLDRPDAEPEKFSGHTSNLKKCVWLDDDKRFVSVSDDKSVKLWDRDTNSEVKSIQLSAIPGDVELSGNGRILVIPHGNVVGFYDSSNLELIKKFDVPTQVYSASLLLKENVFVCGGEDFKMYKFNYSDGAEIESFKGHFGPIHCVRFSPDGELYASGSEDGTLRLWQTTVGRTYGLWKCVTPDSEEALDTVAASPTPPPQMGKAEP